MAAHTSSATPNLRQESVSYKLLGDDKHGRILCLADVRGRLSTLNELALETGALAIIHTGDFGFFGTVLLRLLSRSVANSLVSLVSAARWFQSGSYQ